MAAASVMTIPATAGQRKPETRETAGRRTSRVVVLASADAALRRQVTATLEGLRWEVLEAAGGAELFACMERRPAGTIVLDSWLPDLDVEECVRELAMQYPMTDLLALDGTEIGVAASHGSFRNEVLHAVRCAQQTDQAAWSGAPREEEILAGRVDRALAKPQATPIARPAAAPPAALPGILGNDPRMLELSRRIRLVAPRSTTVLVQGPTGTGKELVARALHILSPRAAKPFVALNCAAIPEALLEAELFGHTRGAFTGAVQGRVGRLEAAHGGTLFLDEIGELPLALQAKLLRFVECGELQRVGENEPVRVDVRIIAATHRRLGKMAAEGIFRQDLYYRLSVFLIQTPALNGRAEDIRLLARHAMSRLGLNETPKTLAAAAMERLAGHSWPGNVRELEHTIERAWILAGERAVIDAGDIDFGEDIAE